METGNIILIAICVFTAIFGGWSFYQRRVYKQWSEFLQLKADLVLALAPKDQVKSLLCLADGQKTVVEVFATFRSLSQIKWIKRSMDQKPKIREMMVEILYRETPPFLQGDISTIAKVINSVLRFKSFDAPFKASLFVRDLAGEVLQKVFATPKFDFGFLGALKEAESLGTDRQIIIYLEQQKEALQSIPGLGSGIELRAKIVTQMEALFHEMEDRKGNVRAVITDWIKHVENESLVKEVA